MIDFYLNFYSTWKCYCKDDRDPFSFIRWLLLSVKYQDRFCLRLFVPLSTCLLLDVRGFEFSHLLLQRSPPRFRGLLECSRSPATNRNASSLDGLLLYVYTKRRCTKALYRLFGANFVVSTCLLWKCTVNMLQDLQTSMLFLMIGKWLILLLLYLVVALVCYETSFVIINYSFYIIIMLYCTRIQRNIYRKKIWFWYIVVSSKWHVTFFLICFILVFSIYRTKIYLYK